MVADNRTSDLAAYDNESLAALLRELPPLDLDSTGWDAAALADLLVQTSPPSLDDLFETHGEPDPETLWPVLRVRCPPELLARYHKLAVPPDSPEGLAVVVGLAERAIANE